MVDPLTLAIGGLVVKTFWGGVYAGAASKPKQNRRNPEKPAHAVATEVTGVVGLVAGLSTVVGPHAAAACGLKVAGTGTACGLKVAGAGAAKAAAGAGAAKATAGVGAAAAGTTIV